jgi:hypothetical protein
MAATLGMALLSIGCAEQKPTPPETTWVAVPFTEYEIAVPADCDFVANDGSERQPLGRSAPLGIVRIQADDDPMPLSIGLAEHHFPNGIRAVNPDLTSIDQVLAEVDDSEGMQKLGFWLRDEVYRVIVFDPKSRLVGSVSLFGARPELRFSDQGVANVERLEAIMASVRPMTRGSSVSPAGKAGEN